MTAQSKIQQFVDDLLVFKSMTPAPNTADDVAWRIWKILTKEQRLARRPDTDFKQKILDKIKSSINQKQPITLINATGGFKNFAAPTFPHTDWSEVFMLNKLLKQCVAIAAIYEPGVRLEFSADSYMLSFFDNYPPETIDTYIQDFGTLLTIFQKQLPANVKISQKNMNEFYDVAKLQQRLTKMADALNEKEVDELFANYRDKAKNNFMVNGIKDYSRTDPHEFEQLLRRSVVLDHLWIEVDVAERLEYLEGGLHIPLIQTAIPGCIALKSVNTSKLAFWLGVGYVRSVNNKLLPYIQHGQKWSELKDVAYCDVSSPFAEIAGMDKMPYIAAGV